MMHGSWCRGAIIAVGLLALSACGTAQVSQRDDDASLPPATGGGAGLAATGGTTSSGSGGSGATIGTGGTITLGGMGGSSAGSGGMTAEDPCKSKDCAVGQRCQADSGTATCVDKTCDELACKDTELCQSAQGGGHICVDKCTSDAACDEALHCDTTTGECLPDECTPDTRMCGTDDTIRVCSSNGAPGDPIHCGSGGYFMSQCSADAAGSGACTCEDDWDCPAFMTCEAGTCIGTGVAPTCTLPVASFKDVLPAIEFRWGEGTKHSYNAMDSANDDAVGKAFPWSSQVVSPPLVVNLDDDNGDGRADERDFPEILFLSHTDDKSDTDGVVRAVHGGGMNKGQDFFALCGNPARPATPAASYSDANGAYWSEGADVISDCSDAGPNLTGGLARPAGGLAAGDLDGDGFPEIVVPLETKGFQILSNRGEVLFTSPDNVFEPAMQNYAAPTPALANLDFQGMPEIILGNRVVSLTKDAGGHFAIDKIYVASAGARGSQNSTLILGPTTCVADLTADPGLEIAAGPTLYRLPASPPAGCGSVATPCPLETVWDARSSLGMQQQDGLCAVADVLGACTSASDCAAHPPGPSNPLDGKPEVVLISNGHLVILDGAKGTVLMDQDLGGGDGGGAPNVDDFDGDGFPEIATALANFYRVIDLQSPDPTNCPAWDTVLDKTNPPPQTNPPRNAGGACKQDSDCTLSGTTCNETSGHCVCLHNGWKRSTEDDSSRVTSSSVFDFNGDGAAEVTYGDECYFRIYDGSTGEVYLAFPSVSRTILENPVVADVDNDGNAEIVFVQNNHFSQCDEGNVATGQNWMGAVLNDWPTGTVAKDSLPTGITVLGDPTDSWVTARRIWNQHAYHVTNVLESGAIPLHEPESWKPLNGRVYNTYRSQPRNYGVAPDLTLTAIQISSPDAKCGVLSEKIQITVVVKNAGDLRVGPGVEVAFYGTWGGAEAPLDDSGGNPIVVVLDKSLEPGASTLVTVAYDVGNNPAPDDTALPDSVRVTIDGGNNAMNGKERECREDNNELTHPVNPGEALADLVATVDSANCAGKVAVTVSNVGADGATHVVVRVYAGDPTSGGELLGETTIDSLAAGASSQVMIDVGALSRNVTIWAIADPDDTVKECNDANNVVEGPALMCKDEPR
jgi:hypothetical protein